MVGKEDNNIVLMKLKCKLENREGNSERVRDVDEVNSEISDLNWDVIRERYKDLK